MNKKLVIDQFGSNAANYVTSKRHAKGKDLDTILEIIKGNENACLLDIATGGGHVANKLAPEFKEVIALDLTEEMLENAQKFIQSNGHTNVSFVQGDAEALPFTDKKFDTVTCRVAPHHFPDVAQFTSEVFRVLTEDGLFLLIDNVAPELDEYDQFYNYIEKKRDPSHFRAYKKSEWISLLEQKGFSIKSFSTFTKKFLYDEWCRTMSLSEKNKQELNEYMVSSSKEMIEFFSIEINEDRVHSFKGETMILVAERK